MFGAAARALIDALHRAGTYDARVAAAETWLARRFDGARGQDAILSAARRLRAAGGCLAIRDLARSVDLGDRQFTRGFTRHVGLPPKLYARLLRFEHALADKAATPEQTWAALAHDAGFADQAHLVRDFRAFSGLPPARLFARWRPLHQ